MEDNQPLMAWLLLLLLLLLSSQEYFKQHRVLAFDEAHVLNIGDALLMKAVGSLKSKKSVKEAINENTPKKWGGVEHAFNKVLLRGHKGTLVVNSPLTYKALLFGIFNELETWKWCKLNQNRSISFSRMPFYPVNHLKLQGWGWLPAGVNGSDFQRFGADGLHFQPPINGLFWFW